jgi:hypothetical protein
MGITRVGGAAATVEDVDAASLPALIHRLTVVPAAFLVMKFASRSCFISVATRFNAKSHDTCLNSLTPGARYLETFSQVSACAISRSAEPFGHSVPRFAGWSGSASMWIMSDLAFFARSPRL